MPSNDLQSDAVAVFAEHGKTILTVGVVAVLLLVVLGLFGRGNVVGGLFFLGYAVVWLVVLAFVLWLFYRLVTAVERIAAAQERLASSRAHDAAGSTDDEEDGQVIEIADGSPSADDGDSEGDDAGPGDEPDDDSDAPA